MWQGQLAAPVFSWYADGRQGQTSCPCHTEFGFERKMAKDLEKRRRIMQRSIKLGHCICDPKKACPCQLLRDKDVCLCAGERLEAPEGPVRLTRLVEKAGCASKIDRASLKRALAGLPELKDPNVLVGMAAGDDAGVYRLNETTALVQTVDVFSPSVDDPYTFGQVAAANSLSDVYAMGGRPLTALSVIGFPIGVVPDSVMRDILRGGIDKMNEAGVPVVGGHSIKDDEIKAGFAVTGVIDPKRILTNANARPGDALVLTKPIGTGIIAFAAQIDRAPAGSAEAAAASMTLLNRTASELMVAAKAHAATDVTGFGLIGHLAEMASSSGVDVEIVWDDVPLLPGAVECAAAGILSGGVERNRESSAAAVTLHKGARPLMLDVLLDPQTSGGLLIVLPVKKAAALVAKLRAAGMPESAVIGRVLGKGKGRIHLASTGRRMVPSGEDRATHASPLQGETHSEECCADMAKKDNVAGARHAVPAECCADSPKKDEPCCAGASASEKECCAGGDASSAGAGDVQAKFVDFMRAANAPGAIDGPAKQLIAVALSLAVRCEPCAKHHLRQARRLGCTPEQIDEAVSLAIVFGGSPAMMFYKSVTSDE